MSNSTPDMLIDVDSHLKETSHLSTLEHGAYFGLLMNYWGTGHPIKADDDRISKILSITLPTWMKIKDTVTSFFYLEDGTWRHLELDDQLARRGKTWRKIPLGRRIVRPKIVSNRPPAAVWQEIRVRIFDRDDYTCQYCGQRGGKLECDHIHPVSRGGTHEDSNLTTACRACNRDKRAKTLLEWRGF